MLIKLEAFMFEEFAEQAYEMAMLPEITSYPVYYDGIKTQEDFLERAEKAFARENEEILLFYREDEFSGWIHFYALPEDQYLATVSMSAREGIEQMLDEFLVFAAQKYPDFSLYLGFPEENQAALAHLQALGFVIEEQSWNMVLHMASWKNNISEGSSLITIGKENYSLFRQIHAQWDGKIYWDSQHIYEDLPNWLVFVAMEHDHPIAAVYCMRGEFAEIFGIDFADGRYDGQTMKALLTAMIQACRADGTTNLVYFCDDREKTAVLDAGFSCIGKYIMVKCSELAKM